MDVMMRMTDTNTPDEALDTYLTDVIELTPVQMEQLKEYYLVGYADNHHVSELVA